MKKVLTVPFVSLDNPANFILYAKLRAFIFHVSKRYSYVEVPRLYPMA